VVGCVLSEQARELERRGGVSRAGRPPLALRDALPISAAVVADRTIDSHVRRVRAKFRAAGGDPIETVPGAIGSPPAARNLARTRDRQSTRLNSRHLGVPYAVYCTKKET